MTQRSAIVLGFYLVLVHALLLWQATRDAPHAHMAAATRALPDITTLQGDSTWPVHHRRMLGYHARMDANVPDGAVLFFGDSLVQGLCVSAVTPLGINFGIGGDTTALLRARLPLYASIDRASAVVVAIGINDLAVLEPEQIGEHIGTVLDALPPQLPVLLQGVLPVDRRVERPWTGRSRNEIERLNARFIELAKQRGNVHYAAPPRELGEGGDLAARFHDGRGLHLNAIGNALWIESLRQALAQIHAASPDESVLAPRRSADLASLAIGP